MPYFATSDEAPTQARNGSILVVMLAVLLLLSALLLQMQLTARARLSRSVVAMDQLRLRAAMTDAVYQALQRLADDQDLLVDHPHEDWNKEREFKDPTGISMQVDIQDAMARFDLNNIFPDVPDPTIRPVSEVMTDLLLQCGDAGAANRVHALRDWVDPDNEGSRETDFYREKKLAFEPANRPVQTWPELLRINGFDREYVRAPQQETKGDEKTRDLFDTLTLVPVTRSRPLPVNVNTAPRHVLLGILGLDKTALVDTLMAMRENQPIRSLAMLGTRLDNRTMATMQTYLDVKSAYYLVQARADVEGTSAMLRTLVHRRSDGSIEVIQWAM